MTSRGDEASTIVIVSEDGRGAVVPLARAIQEAGHDGILLSNPGPHLRRLRTVYKEVVERTNVYDSEAICDVVRASRPTGRMVGLFSAADGLIWPAAMAAAQLGLPHPPTDALLRSHNKYASRLAMERAGLPTPRFRLISSALDADMAARHVGFPAIIKPVTGAGSHLVMKVTHRDELVSLYRYLAANTSKAFRSLYARVIPVEPESAERLDPRESFLVEEYLQGREFDVDLAIRAGKVERLVIVEKRTDEATFYEGIEATPPFEKSPSVLERVWRTAETAVRVHGIDNTLANIDLIDTGSACFVLDINAGRPGGKLNVRAAELLGGFDPLGELVALQAGMPTAASRPPALSERLGLLAVPPQQTGVVRRVEGLRRVALLPGVKEIVSSVEAGEFVDIRDNKEVFAVNVIVTGTDSWSELEHLYATISGLITIEVAPVEP